MHSQMNNYYNKIKDNLIMFLGIVFFVLSLLGLGISVAVIYSEGKTYSNADTCLTFPINNAINSTFEYGLKQDLLSLWHWSFKNNDLGINVRQSCLTYTHDSEIYINNHLAGRLDGKVFTTESTTYVNDCKGKRKYVLKTGSFEQTLINQNKIVFDLQITDSDNDIIGYIKGTNLFNKNIDVYDVYDNVVANLYGNYLSIPYRWDIKIYNQSSVVSDPSLLSMIAGKQSFSKQSDKTDICNNYVVITGWVIVGTISLVILGLGFYIKETFCDKSFNKSFNKSSISIEMGSYNI